jgi:hypothetical protein
LDLEVGMGNAERESGIKNSEVGMRNVERESGLRNDE